MGKEIGHKCVRRPVTSLVLAFFTVVASSPNLSTFRFCRCKGTKKNEILEMKNEKLLH